MCVCVCVCVCVYYIQCVCACVGMLYPISFICMSHYAYRSCIDNITRKCRNKNCEIYQ